MSEFRIHHDVNELLSLLQVRGGDGAEGYIDLLQKHRTPYVTTTVSAHSAKVSHTHQHEYETWKEDRNEVKRRPLFSYIHLLLAGHFFVDVTFFYCLLKIVNIYIFFNRTKF